MATCDTLLDVSWWQQALPITASAKELIKKAMQQFIDSGDETTPWMEYGFERDSAGCDEFRGSVARFLTCQYGTRVDKETVGINYGASHGLDVILTLVLPGSGPIFCQHPCFASSLTQFGDSKKRIIPVACDECGMIPEDFEKQLQQYFNGTPSCEDKMTQQLDGVHVTQSSKISHHGDADGGEVDQEKDPRVWCQLPERGATLYKGGAYLIPNFCNPTGMCFTEDRSKQIIALARKYDILLICDDVYNMVSFETNDAGELAPIHPRLLQYDNRDDPNYGKGHVVSIGTFSKILFPSIRLGWYELPPELFRYVERLGIMFASGGMGKFMSKFVLLLLDDQSLDAHILRMRRFYKKQTVIFDETLKRCLPPEVTYHVPKGGFSFWCELPSHLNAEELLQMCEMKQGFTFLLGERFSVVPGECKNCFRLCISNCPDEKLAWVAQALSDNIKIMLETAST